MLGMCNITHYLFITPYISNSGKYPAHKHGIPMGITAVFPYPHSWEFPTETPKSTTTLQVTVTLH